MSIISKIIKRVTYPQHLYTVIKLQRNCKKKDKVYEDAQLKLYAQILPGDFLHYGYFDDPKTDPQSMPLNDIYKAQENYGWQIVNLISDKENPVLDIGCGMGGLIKLMRQRNIEAIALTPDVNQVRYIREKYLGTRVLDSRFEDIKAEDYKDYFGTVITSESLQYLDLRHSLSLIQSMLKQDGKWIVCDYFMTGEQGEKSGHNWEHFIRMLDEFGFKITSQRDITPNVLPTIAYVHMWATQIGLPIKDFIFEKIKVKAPGVYYAIGESLPEIEEKIRKNIDIVNPEIFAKNKRYILMEIGRR